MRVARDVSSKEIDAEDFTTQAEMLINNYPELHAITWIDNKQRVKAAYASSSASNLQLRGVGSVVIFKETEGSFAFNLAKDLLNPFTLALLLSLEQSRFCNCTYPWLKRVNSQASSWASIQ
jgi:hypothetical protein